MSFFSDEQNSELRELFFESAAELIQTLNEEGLEWEKDPSDTEIARRIRRTVHTLKGDSAAAGFTELSELAHAFEDALTGDVTAIHGREIAELVLRAADCFSEMLSAYRQDKNPDAQTELVRRVRELSATSKSDKPADSSSSAPEFAWGEYAQLLIESARAAGDRLVSLSVRANPDCAAAVALQMIRNVLEQAGTIVTISPETPVDRLQWIRAVVSTERAITWLSDRCHVPGVTADVSIELLDVNAAQNSTSGTSTASEPLKPPQEPANAPKSSNAPAEPAVQVQAPENSLRVDSARIDAALNLLGELIIGKSMLAQTVHEFTKLHGKDPLRPRFEDSLAFLGRTLGDLQKSIMKIRMVPVDHLFRRFPRMVRDLSRSCGKEVRLQVAGAATDLDKGILDLLAEPLSHIVRNAVDHGIEPAATRTAAGKESAGTVSLNAYHQGNQIVIECSDDGRGIDRARILDKAVESGILSAEEAAHLSDPEAYALVFHPGLSTAAQVTAISGRGVGMDVVKTVIDRLKGTTSVESQLGRGTTIRLKVPLTVAIIKALMFRAGERLFAVPLGSVVEITRATLADIHTVDRHEVLQLRGQTLTLARPGRLTSRGAQERKKIFVIVVTHDERKFGLVVDSLVGEEELVIKPLDDELVATEFVSGASILGDGSVVLILNIHAIVSRLGRRTDFARLGVTA